MKTGWLITESDIFGMQKRRRLHSKNKGAQLQYFSEIKAGDYVVHSVHGIGRYIGVENVEVDGRHRDYLLLQYAGDDKLYVPVEQVSMLHKYIGNEGQAPRLSKMGGSDWSRTQKRAQGCHYHFGGRTFALGTLSVKLCRACFFAGYRMAERI